MFYVISYLRLSLSVWAKILVRIYLVDFDSTLVSVLAAQRQKLNCKKVNGLSMVYSRHSGLAQETRYINAAYEANGDLARNEIAADDILDFGCVKNHHEYGEPCPFQSRLPMELAMIGLASRLGADVILTGSGGDGVATIPISTALATLLKSGRISQAILLR